MAKWTKPLTFEQMLKHGVQMPPCPAVFARLMAILGQQDGHADEVVKVVSTDPVLTAEVLRIANSAAYCFARRIRSVDEAALRLGFSEVWAIANALKGKELFNGSKGAGERMRDRLWRHSLMTAITACALGRRLNPQFTDAYFTAGILHDFAKLGLFQIDPNYAAACKEGVLYGGPLVAAEHTLYGTSHAVLGGELLRYWSVPNTISMLVMEHHDPVNEEDRLGHVRRLLANSDAIAHALTQLCGDGQLSFNKTLPQECLNAIRMSANEWLPVANECERQLKAMGEI